MSFPRRISHLQTFVSIAKMYNSTNIPTIIINNNFPWLNMNTLGLLLLCLCIGLVLLCAILYLKKKCCTNTNSNVKTSGHTSIEVPQVVSYNARQETLNRRLPSLPSVSSPNQITYIEDDTINLQMISADIHLDHNDINSQSGLYEITGHDIETVSSVESSVYPLAPTNTPVPPGQPLYYEVEY